MDHVLSEWIERVRSGERTAAEAALIRVALLLESTRWPERGAHAGNERLYSEVLGEAEGRPRLFATAHGDVVRKLAGISEAVSLRHPFSGQLANRIRRRGRR